MDEKGKYIYCIIGDDKERKFTFPAIGSRADKGYHVRSVPDAEDDSKIFNGVYSISYRDIAAVISASPVMKYPISRKNLMAHQKVLEELMKDFTVLPVKFGTVAGSKNGVSAEERIKKKVLEFRYEELKNLLNKMDNKIELGLKAIWTDMKVIFQEIVDENRAIRELKQKLIIKPTAPAIGEPATLGEMVIHALERKKSKEGRDILNVFKENYVDKSTQKVFGDKMIINSAFLVEKSRVEEFDRLVNRLDKDYNERIKFKYVGPVPPINFVELMIILEGGKE